MIVLDTNALIWWFSDPKQLSKKASEAIADSVQGELLVSSISIWEITLLIKKQRLQIDRDAGLFIEQIGSLSKLTYVPVDNAIAAKSVWLNGDLHQDPADRIIVATTLIHRAKLITSDQSLISYPGVQTIW